MPATEIAPGVLSWASHIDENTIEQAARTARLDVVRKPIALMPDAHLGIGSTVGSVIATAGAILPAAVGVDIGCGVAARETNLTVQYLCEQFDVPPEDLSPKFGPYLGRLRDSVPAGMGQGNQDDARGRDWIARNRAPGPLSDKELGAALTQFGSLGGGNHFVELCADERGVLWLMLHSGSRGIGNQIARRHIDLARGLFQDVELEDRDLAYFTEGTPEFDAYVADMLWAQAWAMANRTAMMDAAHEQLEQFLGRLVGAVGTINVHHNYAARETHGGVDVWVTRKGATSARAGEYGIIPGSMATGSFIVRGLGEPSSYHSCSHGAGRRMSRTQARKTLTPESLSTAMVGKVWQDRDAEALVDEHPGAYKDLDSVMADQADLVEPVTRLVALVNYKGVEQPRGKRGRRG